MSHRPEAQERNSDLLGPHLDNSYLEDGPKDPELVRVRLEAELFEAVEDGSLDIRQSEQRFV
jgi:hypothetical protein